MISLPPPKISRSLILLAWQAALYWIWNERNQRLQANQFRSIDSLFSIIDHQLRNKAQSYRETIPKAASAMMQFWIRQLTVIHRLLTRSWIAAVLSAISFRRMLNYALTNRLFLVSSLPSWAHLFNSLLGSTLLWASKRAPKYE